MNIDLLLNEISLKYNINIEELNEIHNNLLFRNSKTKDNNTSSVNIILPFCNYIYESRCKAIVYNHGLFTQCTNKCNDICNKCNKKLLYGRIEDRLNFKKNNFITKNGKKELPYEIFIKKQNYNILDVENALKKEGLIYEFNNLETKQKSRGRPKKNIITDVNNTCNLKKASDIYQVDDEKEINEDVIEVKEIKINSIQYYITSENILLNKTTKEIVGLYDGERIIRE